jgi:hypothetical protein
MKISKRLLCGGLSLLGLLFSGTVSGQQIGDGYFQPAGVQPMMTDLNVGWPGRVWASASIADRGLGYHGSYFTLGAKTHVGQDILDGRWLLEARGHVGLESGGFFGNLGLERVFTLASAGADISTGFWVDYDNDLQGDFAHAMKAAGISGSIETREWAFHANGYFPIMTSDFAQGDPTGQNCFLLHSIVLQPGIDSALKGFDTLLQAKPEVLAQVNGTIGVGAYGYGSDLVDFFGGVRGRVGMQTQGGLILSAEINHDERFDITGVVQAGWLFGAGARGTEYGLLGNDLEPTLRNDHIVRFQQDLVLAIDPDTGLPYNVFHVDNTADPGLANGTAETPFTTLAAAEGASGADDIIFVREGDGTVRNMDQGITLKTGQLLLGDGVRHIIPLQGGTNFILCNNIDGILPRITNRVGNAVTLADRNTVRGFIIDGTDSVMINGIFGQGTAIDPITDGTIEDVVITGNPVLNGIFLRDIAGDWTFSRNNIQTAFLDGINIENALDPASIFNFTDNVVSNNLTHGIHMFNYDGQSFVFRNNTTNGNTVDGIHLENFVNSAGTGSPLDFINPTASANAGSGISLVNYTGNVRFINSQITDNLTNGVELINVVTPGVLDAVLFDTFDGGTSNITGNGVGAGAGIFNEFGVAGARERLIVTNTTIDNGGTGIYSSASAAGATLFTEIIDNLSISGNSTDGIRFRATDLGSHIATVTNTGAALVMNGNSGNGISHFASTAGGISLLESDISNVAITTSGLNGMLYSSIDDGQINSSVSNVTINGAGGDGVQINVNNLASTAINDFEFDTITMGGVGDDGFDINVGTDTFADFSLTNSTLDNNFTGDHGIEATIVGDDTILGVDTRFRANIVGNTITEFDAGDGIGINTLGDARVFAQIDSNIITNNGFNQVASGAPALPFSNGIDLSASDTSSIFTRIHNNFVSGNGDPGLGMTTSNTGRIVVSLQNNFMSGNDTQDDGTTLPDESNNQDLLAINGVTGSICISMSTNFFTLPAVLTNFSGPGNFQVELDGLTNGLGQPVLIGAFSFPAFGTVCGPAIDAEELAFELAGFAPLP